MKKLFIALTLVTVSCATTQTVKREPSSLEKHPELNLKVLASIYPIAGYERREDDEQKWADTLVNLFNKIQDEGKDKGKTLRGTHAMGSCFDGSLQIYTKAELKDKFKYSDETITRLQKGLFSKPGELKTLMRFANAGGKNVPDTVGDVRGLSFSIDTTGRDVSYMGDYNQDFMMNTTPMFATKNIQEFLEVVKAIRTAQGDIQPINPLFIGSVLEAKKFAEKYNRTDNLSYATEEYWANLPYSHGLHPDNTPFDVVKWKVTPCDGKGVRKESSKGKADDYLQTDIQQRVMKGEVCFYLQAQLFNINTLKKQAKGSQKNWKLVDWIENGGAHWDEKILPYYTVAKLEPVKAKAFSCDGVSFSTRLHATRANQPLGGLARVRAYVEENSRARRLGEKR